VLATYTAPDPNDNMVVEAANAGQADATVGGDEDLLALRPIEGIPVLAPVALPSAH
jgi:predicted nucleic acid-binding protein